MKVTNELVAEERDWILERADRTVDAINDVRDELGTRFDVDVDTVSNQQYVQEVETVFADGDVAVNVAALVTILKQLDVTDDHPGFVADEYLGRRLAATIAGGEPSSTLAEATFHYADIVLPPEDNSPAGMDDLDAALVAGFQTRLSGWPWRSESSPFDVDF